MPMRNTTIAFRYGLLVLCLAAGAADLRGQYLETTVRVGWGPSCALWNPANNKVYIGCNGDRVLSVIDGATNAVISTISLGSSPDFLALNTHENKIYCTTEGGKLVVVDSDGDSILKSVTIAGRPGDLAYCSTLNKLYVSLFDGDRIVVFDAGPDTAIAQIGVRYVGLLFWHPVTNRLFCYTTADGDDTAKAIDCATDQVVAALPISNGYDQVEFWSYNPANELVYLTSFRDVYALSSAGDSVIAVVRCPTGVSDIRAVPAANKLYAACSDIRVIDCGGHTITDSIRIGNYHMNLLFDGAHRKVYCSDWQGEAFYVIDAMADTLLQTYNVGKDPGAMCWNRTNSRVYITDGGDTLVYVIRDTTTGIADEATASVRRAEQVSMVQSTLVWPRSVSGQVIDACGRRIATVQPGPNDLSRLASGVYAVVSMSGDVVTKFVKLR